MRNENVELIGVKNTEVIDRHMSIQEMFKRLVSHGCVDLAQRMDSEQDTAMIVSGGGFGDIWLGKLRDGSKVAIKAWRASAIDQCDYKTLKRATREIHFWSRMKHKHIHQLMGVILFKGVYLGMVSEWMENGNLHEYMRKYPNFDRYRMCAQVTSGIAYMHQSNAVHSDLKALNILVSSEGVAKLTDFGLTTMNDASLAFSNTSNMQAGSIRWAAPEQISAGALSSQETDVYALAMTILEVFTGDVPYSECKRDFQVMHLVSQGILPTRPNDKLQDDEKGNRMWCLLLSCWNREADARPSALDVLKVVSDIAGLKEYASQASDPLPGSSGPDSTVDTNKHPPARKWVIFNRTTDEASNSIHDRPESSLAYGAAEGPSQPSEQQDDYDDPGEERPREAYHGGLKIPSPTSPDVPSSKEVLFPANLISLISNEMWKRGMIKESERFLANTMQTIQAHVMSFTGEDAIVPGVFWLSNVHEVLSFVREAEVDVMMGNDPADTISLDWKAYEHLIQVVKSDLDSLEHNIYYSWMVETKAKLGEMAIPALIESQSLPGFITPQNTRRSFNLFNQNTAPAYSMDDVLTLLNKVLKSLKAFYMESSVTQQVVAELLKAVGVTGFNDLLKRKKFNSWKRAMQIQYNITRLEEWCKSHDMPEGISQLEHLMQAVKMLQLKKSTLADIDIIFDVCWIMTPSQIKRMCENYFVGDYEAPIPPEVMKLVAQRVMPNDPADHLLLTNEYNIAPYELPLPRQVTHPDYYVPAYLDVPYIRRLAGATSALEKAYEKALKEGSITANFRKFQNARHQTSDDEGQVEVSVTLILDNSISTPKRGAAKAPSRRTSVFWTKIDNSVTSSHFTGLAVNSLGLTKPLGPACTPPFTYYHKGRLAKNAVSVTSEGMFSSLVKTVHSKSLNAVSIEFLESNLRALGVSEAAGANFAPVLTGGTNDGHFGPSLATHIGVPRVDALSPLDANRATLIGLLEAEWSCKKPSHRVCYTNDHEGIHASLTYAQLSTWADYLHDHRASLDKPPKLKIIPPAALKVFTPAALPLLQLLASVANPTTENASVPPPAPITAVSENDKSILDFLSYAKEKHGVNPARFQDGFIQDGIGPDVMEALSVSNLKEYGVRLGDAHRLKRAARSWEEEAHRTKASDTEVSDEPAPKVPKFTIAFDDSPSPPPPGYVRSEAERLGQPRRGTKGNFCWQQRYPGEEGGFTFWANLPSPTLDPRDPGLAPTGTVQLRVASGTYIDVLRAPRPEIAAEQFEDDE